jgi:manganese/zinc/iron transport system substrate-binding protein
LLSLRNTIATVLILIGLTLAPFASRAQSRPEPVNVATTVGMIADVVAEIGSDCALVTAIMGSGIDPHVYQASARDVRIFQDADVIFYAGHSLEGQLGEVLAGFARRKPTVAVSGEAISEQELLGGPAGYAVDPHVWMDVSLWAKTVPVIVDTLFGLRPECGEGFADNARRYLTELEALHLWVADAVSSIPEAARILVTAHDAFAYYGRAYGIEVAGIQGISTESEAGVADIREMARVVAERKVPAVFVESTINPRTIQAVVDAAARLGHRVAIGDQLWSDAMGAAGSPGGTYLGMIYENTVNIVTDLGGKVPPLPAELSSWAEKWDLAAYGD